METIAGVMATPLRTCTCGNRRLCAEASYVTHLYGGDDGKGGAIGARRAPSGPGRCHQDGTGGTDWPAPVDGIKHGASLWRWGL